MKESKTAIIDKVTHARSGVAGVEVALPAQSVANLPIPQSQIKSFARSGDDLVLTTVSGEVLVMHGFFADQPGDSSELFAQAETDHAANAGLSADAAGAGDADSSTTLAQTAPADAASTTSSATAGSPESADSLASTDTSAGASTGAGAVAAGAAEFGILGALPLIIGGAGIAAKGSDSHYSPGTDTPTAPTAPTVGNVNQNPDGTLTVSGQAQPNDRVTVTYPDGSSSTAVVDASGNYTAQSSTVQGTGNVTVTGSNGSHSMSQHWTDTTAPQALTASLANDTGDSNNDKITSDGTLKLSGIEAGARVEYSTDGNTWNAAQPAWVQGSNTVYVRQTDAAGNVSDASQPLTFTYDTTLSAAAQGIQIGWVDPDTSRDPQTKEWPPLGRDFITSAQNLSVGVMIPGNVGPLNLDERVQINLGDGVWHETTVSFDQYFLYDATGITLEPGTHSFQARVVDRAGNVVVSKSQEVVIDITAPPALGVTLANDTGASASDQITSDGALAFTGIEPGARVEYSIDGAIWNPSFTPVEGANTVQVRQTDVAGNASATSSISFTLDKTAPVAPTLTLTQSKDTIHVAGLETATGTTWQYQIDNGSWVDGAGATIPVSALTANSSHTVLVKQTDVAGNVSTSGSITFTLETTTPQTLTIDSYTDDQAPKTGNFAFTVPTNDTTPVLNGTAASGAVVTISQSGTAIGSTAADAGGNWHYNLPALSEGTHGYTATAPNEAGKTETANVTLTVDTTPPTQGVTIDSYIDDVNSWGSKTGVITFDKPTDDTTPIFNGTFTGTLAANEFVAIYRGDAYAGSASVSAGTHTWQFQDSPLADGSYNYMARVEDLAGNASTIQATVTLTVDTTIPPQTPTVTIMTFADDAGPVTGTFGPDAWTDDIRPVLQGEWSGAISGDYIRVYEGTTLLGTVTPAPWNGWSFALPMISTEGVHTYTAVFTDTDNYERVASDPFSLVVHSGNPITYTDNVGSITGTFYSGTTTTDDTTPTLNGKLAATDSASFVRVYEGTKLLGSTAVDTASGMWSFTVPQTTEGNHSYTVVLTDADGKEGTTLPPFTLTVDTTPPGGAAYIETFTDDFGAITGTFGPNAWTDDTTPTLNGAWWGAGWWGGVRSDFIRIYEGTTLLGTVHPAPWSGLNFTVPETTEGIHTYTAVITDAAGNEGTASAPFTVVIHGGNPITYTDNVGSITGTFYSGTTTTDDTTPTLNGKLNDTDSASFVRVYEGTKLLGSAAVDTAHGTWSFMVPETTEGDHSYTVVLTDADGKEGTTLPPFPLTVDTTPPGGSISIESYTDDFGAIIGTFGPDTWTDDTTPTLNGSWAGAGWWGGVRSDFIRIYEGTTLLGTDHPTPWGGLHFTVPETTEGSHTYTAVFTDAAGNEGPVSAPFTIHIGAPTPPPLSLTIDSYTDDQAPKTGYFASTVPTNDTTPVLNGTTASGTLVTISQSGTVIGSTTADANGKWHYELPTQSEGTHSYTASAHDTDGTMTTSDPFTIIVHTDNGGEPVLTNLVSFADFSDLSHFVLSESVATGNATPVADPDGATVLRLTPSLSWQSGAAFLDTAVPSTMDGVSTSFSTSFQMRISDSAESNGDGADGIVFVIADKANTIGGAGGSIGYGGISPSVGIEFDTWDNGEQDSNDGNHVGININGSMTSVQLQHFPTLFDDGEIVYAWVDYNGMDETLSVYVATTPVRPAAPLIERSIDFAGIFDSGAYYFGFTAGTGDLHTTHDVLAWSLDVSTLDATVHGGSLVPAVHLTEGVGTVADLLIQHGVSVI